jgi:hypothetical protein
MYDVTITNEYLYPVTVEGEKPIAAKGGQGKYTKWGNKVMDIPGMGPVNFIDLGDKKLEGFTDPKQPWTEQTWGGLIRYRGVDAYFRYEGEGSVKMSIDPYGSLTVVFAQGGEIISLPEMVTGE